MLCGLLRRSCGPRRSAAARRLRGRVVRATLVVALFVACTPLFEARLDAQVDLAVCLRANMGDIGPGGSLGPDRAPSITGLVTPTQLLGNAHACAEDFAQRNLIDAFVWDIYWALALIIVVWTGLQVMFGGQFGIGEVVNLVLLLGVPFAILTWYANGVGTPWGDMTFTRMVTGMGITVSQELIRGAFVQFNGAVWDVFSSYWETVGLTEVALGAGQSAESADEGSSRLGFVARLFSDPVGTIAAPFIRVVIAIYQTVRTATVLILLILMIVIPAMVAYCSFLWGYLSVLAAVIIGPLFVPMMLIPQLNFLFWGWFKTLLGASVHMMVAAAVFVVASQILTIPLFRFKAVMDQLVPRADPAYWTGFAHTVHMASWMLETIPLVLIAWLGAFKIGELANMVMSGGAMPGSGLGDRVRGVQQLRSAGQSAMALGRGAAGALGTAAAAKATAGAAAAAAVVSQATRMRR